MLSVKKKPEDRAEADLDAIADHLRKVSTFDHLKMEPDSLAEALQYKSVVAETVLCYPGETGTYYYVLSGSATAKITREDGTGARTESTSDRPSNRLGELSRLARCSKVHSTSKCAK